MKSDAYGSQLLQHITISRSCWVAFSKQMKINSVRIVWCYSLPADNVCVLEREGERERVSRREGKGELERERERERGR